MNLLTFLLALALPTLLGWVLLLILEKNHPVLGRTERMFWALILGPTLFTLIVFLSQVLGLTKLNLFGFLIPLLLVLSLLLFVAQRTHALQVRHAKIFYAQSAPLSRFLVCLILLLSVWAGMKVLAGTYDLISVPTSWDDSFNNWNMRGKMFFFHQKLVLEIPIGNGLVQPSDGVSSYPPSVPLLKTWLSVLRGSWQEPLINGLHIIWLVGLIGSFYFALRRRLSPLLSLGGVCLLISLPLFLIQAMNPYADIFLAAHLFLAMMCVYRSAQAQELPELSTWMKLSGFAIGILLFTKNEASVLYAPLLLFLLIFIMLSKKKNNSIDAESVRKLLGTSFLIVACIGAPWILFKWFHGLSFGNAKSVSGMHIAFHPAVPGAIWYHLSHEPNWLLLPFVLPLTLLLSGKRAFRLPEGVLTVFLFAAITAQFLIFTFTPLATEAIMQTGLSRGLLHIAPIAMLLVMVLAESLLNGKHRECYC